MKTRTYTVGKSIIRFVFGDITTSGMEVIVSSDDSFLSMGGGVSAAILHAGGNLIRTDASKLTPARVGDVVVTTAGNLPAKYIIHAIALGTGSTHLPPGAIVRQTTQRTLNLLPVLGCRSVAFPTIGAGVAGIPHETVASEMAAAIVGTLLDSKASHEVELYLMDRLGRLCPEEFFAIFERVADQSLGLHARSDSQIHALLAPPEHHQDHNAEDEGDRRHQVFTMLMHLDLRRNQLESRLVDMIASRVDAGTSDLQDIRTQLDEILQLRRNYESQLTCDSASALDERPGSVFVSSTSADLKEHRSAMQRCIEKLQLQFIGMEDFAPTSEAPAELIRKRVIESKVYLGIIGFRYGYVDPATGFSMTELEYRQAVASNKRICMFVMDQSAPILASMVEDNPERFAKLLDFKWRVLKAHTCALFTDPADLARKAELALREVG